MNDATKLLTDESKPKLIPARRVRTTIPASISFPAGTVLLDIRSRKGYDIATAMRGPDFEAPGSGDLKIITTSVIRSLAGMDVNDHGAIVYTPVDAISVFDGLHPEHKGRVVDLLLSDKANHFRRHFISGIKWFEGESIAYRRYLAARIVTYATDPNLLSKIESMLPTGEVYKMVNDANKLTKHYRY